MDEKTIIESKLANVKRISIIIASLGIILFFVIFFSVYSFGNGRTYNIPVLIFQVVPLYMACTILPCLIIAIIFYYAASKIELTVTNKRVYGKTSFGKRVDLPFDMISAVGTSAFKGIAVTTPSGAIKFIMMENRDSIHDAISKQLVNRQANDSKKADTVIKQEVPLSNADELRKYKELLDSGVISQEEFDAKKKQLLGL